MYCPQCSQQQVSEEMRFCSRCGFPLSAVKDLIASGGVSEELPPKTERSPAMRGARQGTWIMLAAVFLSLFVGLLSAIDDGFAVLLLVPVLCFVVGFGRLFYGVFVQDRAERRKNLISGVSTAFSEHPPSVGRNKELPAATSQPARAYMPPIKTTAEVVQSTPSVTENTTRLLDEGSDSPRR